MSIPIDLGALRDMQVRLLKRPPVLRGKGIGLQKRSRNLHVCEGALSASLLLRDCLLWHVNHSSFLLSSAIADTSYSTVFLHLVLGHRSFT